MDIREYLLNNSSYKQGKKIAVAVSGGADSMALLTMTCHSLGSQYVVALTFDHKLRKESRIEAEFVADYCCQIGCSHKILSLDNEQRLKANQNDARLMRYRHLLAYCIANNISYLLTAHHRNDQTETYYIRLLQNSELWGMASIADYSQSGHIHILRPLISKNSVFLKEYLIEKNIKWVDDPSNQNQKYLRTQVRNLLQDGKLSTVDNQQIQHYRNIITNIVNDWCRKNIKIKGAGCITIPKIEFMAQSLELRFHILRLCLQYVGRKAYFISLSLMENIYDKIISSSLFSIGNCLTFSDNKDIYIQHEYRKDRPKDIFTFDNRLSILDNRFHIYHPQNKKIELAYLGDFQNNFSEKLDTLIQKSKKKKYRYIQSLPIVIYDKNTILYPEVNQENWKDLDCEISVIGDSAICYCQKYFIDPSF